MTTLNVDEVYDIIGHLGFSQIIYLNALSTIGLILAPHLLLNIFAGLEPSFKCYKRSEEGNTTYLTGSCYQRNVSNCNLRFFGPHYSIVNEWNLVCNDKYKVALVQSVFMGGIMVGALLLSSLADHFGRMRTLLISIMMFMVFEGLAAFAYSYVTFVGLRFCGGVVCSVLIISSFVLMQELIGTTKRSLSVIISALFFPLGIALLSCIAAFVTDWRTLTLLCSALLLPVLILLPIIVPESPRWLASKGRTEEAKRVLEKMAEANGTSHLLPASWQVFVGSDKEKGREGGVLALATHPQLRRITLIQIYSWFVNSAVYYALTMAAATANPKGNVYWDTTLNGFVEVPSNLSLLFILERYGRKFALCLFMIGGGAFSTMVQFVPPSFATTFYLIGKLSISASFSIIYLHSSEIFPTVIRNSGMGVVAVASRIGGIISPFILMLGDVRPNLHFAVLGLATFLAGVLNMGLPETLGHPMPETVEDLVNLINTSKKGQVYSQLPEEADDEGETEEISFLDDKENLPSP